MGKKDRRSDGGESVFLVRIDEVPPGQSAGSVPAPCAERVGVVSLGVRDLSPQDVTAQGGVG